MRDNENASAGGIITFVTVFLVAGTLFVCCGFAVDKITAIAQLMYTASQTSQMRFDIVTWEVMVFRVEPIILLIGAGINYMVNSLREYTGSIALGTILVGAAEMITLTLVIIAVTIYGGAGMDSVINTVDGWQIGGNTADLFFATTFIGPVVYGILLLITIGLVVQFLILCVQTVDYSTSRPYAY